MSMIEDQDLFIEKTAYELIWGYTDPLLELLAEIDLYTDPVMRIEVSWLTVAIILWVSSYGLWGNPLWM